MCASLKFLPYPRNFAVWGIISLTSKLQVKIASLVIDLILVLALYSFVLNIYLPSNLKISLLWHSIYRSSQRYPMDRGVSAAFPF